VSNNSKNRHSRAIAALKKLIKDAGLDLRHEKLAAGRSWRTRSAGCSLGGEPVLFVDKNLPEEKQVAILIDYVADLKLDTSGLNEGLFSGEELLRLGAKVPVSA